MKFLTMILMTVIGLTYLSLVGSRVILEKAPYFVIILILILIIGVVGVVMVVIHKRQADPRLFESEEIRDVNFRAEKLFHVFRKHSSNTERSLKELAAACKLISVVSQRTASHFKRFNIEVIKAELNTNKNHCQLCKIHCNNLQRLRLADGLDYFVCSECFDLWNYYVE